MNFFSKPKSPIIAVINLSESGVQGGLLSLENPNDKENVFVHRTAKKTTADGAIKTISELEKSVDAVIKELLDAENETAPRKGGDIKDFFFVVDSPFQHNYLSEVSFKDEKPVKINRVFIQKMMDEKVPESDNAPNLIKEKKDSLEFIKKDIIEVRLNGYPANQFDEVEARSIELLLFNSVAPKELLDSVRLQVGKRVGASSVHFFSRAEADISFLNHFRKKHLYKYVNINMSETLIVFVDRNIVRKIFYIKQGYSDLIQRIAKEFDVPDFVAVSYASMYFSGECERSFSKKMEELILFGIQLWELEYEKKMAILPEEVYLNSNSHTEDSFKQILTKKHPETKVSTLRELYAESTGYSASDKVLEMAISGFFINQIQGFKEG
jgi:hypothetical protein